MVELAREATISGNPLAGNHTSELRPPNLSGCDGGGNSGAGSLSLALFGGVTMRASPLVLPKTIAA